MVVWKAVTFTSSHCCIEASRITPISGPHKRPEPPSKAIATGTSATFRPNTVGGSM